MNTCFKSKGVLIILLMMAGTMLQAQGKVGLRAGVLISKQDFQQGNVGEGFKSKAGADIALVTEFPIGPVFAVGPEFHWIQKGGKIEDLNGPLGESSRTFNYLEVPILFRLNFGEGVGFFLLAGPSIGYLLDGSDKDQDGNTNDIDVDFYKRAEVGGHIGGGVAFGPLKVDVRYIVGFSNIADFTDLNGEDVEVKNSGFGAGISFMF
jgi:Outer membrane protein beta-barrel domain